MQQQFISQPLTYTTSAYPASSYTPVAKSVVTNVVPQVQSVVPQVSMVPQVQSVVPQVSMVPQVPAVPAVTPYVQPLGSRLPILQNHMGAGLVPGSFSTLGGSPYGRVSQIVSTAVPVATPATSIVTPVTAVTPVTPIAPGLQVANPVGMVNNPELYTQHVQVLRNAFQGAGTNEDDICRVIASTNNGERIHIRRLYNQTYNEDLVKRLKSELSGDFKEAAIGSFLSPAEYDAYCLYYAMKGLGTKESVLTEIIGSRTPQELQAIKQVYAANYGETLEKAVIGDTSGDYKNLLLALLQCNRSYNTTPDMAGCQQDAAVLYQAGEGKWGTDEATFIRIFSQRSPAELALINQYYKQNTGKGLLGAIDAEFSGDTKSLLNTIITANEYPTGFYAKNIHDSMKGAGTNDSKLIRNICARHGVDLPQIRHAYQTDYGSDMLTDLQADTSGHYRRVLSALVGNAQQII